MKKLSLIIAVLWLALPLAVKATENDGMHPDWFWFSIIWFVMGIAHACAVFLFSMIENYQEDEIEKIKNVIREN
jgi:hypothetical protein